MVARPGGEHIEPSGAGDTAAIRTAGRFRRPEALPELSTTTRSSATTRACCRHPPRRRRCCPATRRPLQTGRVEVRARRQPWSFRHRPSSPPPHRSTASRSPPRTPRHGRAPTTGAHSLGGDRPPHGKRPGRAQVVPSNDQRQTVFPGPGREHVQAIVRARTRARGTRQPTRQRERLHLTPPRTATEHPPRGELMPSCGSCQAQPNNAPVCAVEKCTTEGVT